MKRMTVGGYLIQRLTELGVRHVFGIPGDYVLGFYDQMLESKLKIIGTCTENGAALAADAYARVNGLGVVCVTYCVGGLNTVNATAGAYAEKSPMVVISGAPGMDERRRSSLLHHKVRNFNTQQQVFREITVAAVALEDPATAPDLIDSALAACMQHKRPVFIEIPRDMNAKPCRAPRPLSLASRASDPSALGEALAEATERLKNARKPVILAGVEIHRFGLQNALLELAAKTGYPIATTLLGKSVISERHPQYLGVYEGAMGRDEVRRAVEEADCLLILGAFMTDINLGVYTAEIDQMRTINATSERILISHHQYDDIVLKDFIAGLTKSKAIAGKQPRRPGPSANGAAGAPFRVKRQAPLTIRRLFGRINDFLEDDMIVVADVGDSLFGAVDLTIHRRTEFLSPAYYTSMGFAVPAALGAQIGNRKMRPVVLVGDGAFQMTGHELSSIAKYKLNPIVIILDNDGYSTERAIQDGPYNDIHPWQYHRWPEIIGIGWGTEVRTEGEFDDALQKALKNRESLSVIQAHLERKDYSAALVRLGKRLAEQGGLKGNSKK